MSEIIDAHQHFWDRSQPFDYEWLDAWDKAPIAGTFLPDDLWPHLQKTGVSRTVLVQTQHSLDENRWALSLAEHHEFIAGVVGWIDLSAPDCEAQLLMFLEHPKFVGVRHITQDEPDDDFIIRPEVIRGLEVLQRHTVPFDLLFYVKHLQHAETLARRLPGLPMVIDHLAKPRIKEQATEDWWPHLKAAAEFPNVYCKLSGMVTEADHQLWTPEDLRPYIQTALELFGPDRCMFGSDWPVCQLAASYETVFHALQESISLLSPNEKASILGDTARRFYGLADTTNSAIQAA